jgi:hypothetical protein
VQPSVDTAPDAPVGTIDKGNEQNVPYSAAAQCDVSTSSRIDWSSYYIEEELRALKVKLINLRDYPNKDISYIEFVVCDSAMHSVYKETPSLVAHSVYTETPGLVTPCTRFTQKLPA